MKKFCNILGESIRRPSIIEKLKTIIPILSLKCKDENYTDKIKELIKFTST